MSRNIKPVPLLLAAGLLAFAALAGWRVFSLYQADRFADQQPARALQWRPDHPLALRRLAEQQLAAGKIEESRATARHLLRVEPLEGRGFRLLAEAAAAQGDQQQAHTLYQIAARRSPRDVRTRGWLIEHSLVAGDYRAALQHVDALLRTSPGQGSVLMPLLAKLAVDPVFAIALADTLATRPPWRGNLLATLQRVEDPSGADQVLSALRSAGGLNTEEFDQWIASLIQQGRWGEAYSRWAGTLELGQGGLPLIYNGQFEQLPSARGFDWRLLRIPGVSLDFHEDPGVKGLAARALFRGRPVAQVNLEQPLLLGPGTYLFSARMRGQALRSERGLEWAITCLGQSEPLATSPPLQGTFDWRAVEMEVVVPANDCHGQWLRLRNPVPGGSIQQVSGELWLGDVGIQPAY